MNDATKTAPITAASARAYAAERAKLAAPKQSSKPFVGIPSFSS